MTLTELIALRLRGIPLDLVVDNRVAAVRSGLPLSIDDLSTHFLAGRECADGRAGADCRAEGRHPPRF